MSGSDFLISGEASVSPIKVAVGEIVAKFDLARAAMLALSSGTVKDSASMKAAIATARDAMAALNAQIALTANSGTLNAGMTKGLQNGLKDLNLEFKNTVTQAQAFAREFAASEKAIKDSDRDRTNAQKANYQARKLDLADESAKRKQAASQLRSDWSEAIRTDRDRTAAAKKASVEIANAHKTEIASNNAVLTSLKALAAGFSFQMIRSFVSSTIDAAIAMDKIRNSLNAATGSLQEGGEAFTYVRKVAYGLGLDLEALAKQYGLFLAATNETGLSLHQQRAIFESIAEATRVLGLSTEDMQGSFVALQQIMTKGTVQMEELRQQLGDRLPGSIRIMAKALNVTQKEMYNFSKNGVIPAKESLIQFSEEVRKALVDPTLGTALESIQTKFNNLKNVAFELKSAFGHGFGQAVAAELDITNKSLDNAKESASAIGKAWGMMTSSFIQGLVKIEQLGRGVGAGLQAGIGMAVVGVEAGIGAMLGTMAKGFGALEEAMSKIGQIGMAKQFGDAKSALDGYAGSLFDAADAARDFVSESDRIAKEQIGAALNQGTEAAAKLSDALDRTRMSTEELSIARVGSNKALGLNQAAENSLLVALGIEVERQRDVAASIMDGAAAREEETSKLTDQEKAVRKLGEAVWKEVDAIEGSTASLGRKGIILQEAVKIAERDGIVTAASSETIKQKVGEQYDAYERLGEAVPKWLQAIGDKYGAISKAQQSFLDDLIAAADKAEERMTRAKDQATDSSGRKLGTIDLDQIETEILDAQQRRQEAVAALLAATDSAGVKKAQKQVDDADKIIEDRIKRRSEIQKKITAQDVESAKDPKKEAAVKELEKRREQIEQDIAELEVKQAGGSLSTEELDRLFAAQGALQDVANELNTIGPIQEDLAAGWEDIWYGTNAATDAWEEYYTLVEANAVKAKLALEEQAAGADEVAGAAVRIEGSFEKVKTVLGDVDIYGNKIVNTTDEMIEGITTGTEQYMLAADAAGDLANGAEKATEATKELGKASETEGEITKKNLQDAAEAANRMRESMSSMVFDLMPSMNSLMERFQQLATGTKLGKE